MQQQPSVDFGSLQLHVHAEPVPLATQEDNRQAALSMARQARRSIDILSHDLEAPVYGHPEFVEAVRQFVVNHRQGARVRILVNDLTAVLAYGHRLVDLARRLTSFLEIKRLSEAHADYPSAFLVADRTGTLFRPVAHRYEGSANFHNPLEARELTRQFDGMWGLARTDPNLHSQYL